MARHTTLGEIPTLNEWKNATAVWNKRRSPLLQKVDEAINNWETRGKTEALRLIIKTTLNNWCDSKGAGNTWMNNDRNKSGAILGLYEIVNQPTNNTYKKTLEKNRVNVLFLLGNLKADSSMFDIMLDAAGSTAASIFGATTKYGLTTKGSNTEFNNKLYGMASTSATGILKEPVANRNLKVIPRHSNTNEQSSWERFRQTVSEFFEWMWKSIVKTFTYKKGVHSYETVKGYQGEIEDLRTVEGVYNDYSKFYGVFKNIMMEAVKAIWAASAPFVGDIAALSKHLYKFGGSVVKAVSAKYYSFRVKIIDGHPAAICKALRESMCNDALGSLYQSIKYSLTITINLMFPGPGEIVSAISKTILYVVEKIIEFAKRFAELKSIRKHLSKAKKHFELAEKTKNEQGLHLNEKEFTKWFNEMVEEAPLLAALVLNSGICGDAMHFLSMFKNGTKLISQEEFNRGVDYRNSLKNYSTTMLSRSKMQFYCPNNEKRGNYINGLVNLAKGITTTPPKSEFSKFLLA